MVVGSTGGLNGKKSSFLEGGIRVPYILRWPGKLPAGSIYTQPVSTMDLYPTFLAAAGVSVPERTQLDGSDLLPYLRGEKTGTPHESLFWKSGLEGAVRQGDWKLVVSGKTPTRQLFNLAEDAGEKKDLLAEKQELQERLHQAWLKWSSAFAPRASGQQPSKSPRPVRGNPGK